MGGYGFYVWGSFLLSAVVLALLLWVVLAAWQREKAATHRYWQRQDQAKDQSVQLIIEDFSQGEKS
jgi:heme exporter protein CcmD